MKRLLLALALVGAAVAGPAAPCAGSAPSFFFGFADDAFKLEPSRAFSAARDLGARAVRVTLMWEPGQTDLSTAQIQDLGRAVTNADGIRVVLAVYSDRGFKAPRDETAREQYCAFVKQALARFPAINDTVIWNEPNLTAFWNPQFNPDRTSASPAAYYALLSRCYDVLHAFRPSVNVIAPATSPRGFDNPTATTTVSHSPVTFMRKLSDAYRASGRTKPILDTFGQVVYGAFPAERPWKQHPGSTRIGIGDWDKLMQTASDAFGGTAQPIPGECAAGRCVSIWYVEGGYQTTVDPAKASLYTSSENVVNPVTDYAGGEPAVPPPSADSLAPDQWTQILDAVRLAYCQPHVEAFFNFLLRDEQDLRRWQSGALWLDWTRKDSYPAFKQAIGEANGDSVDCSRLKGGVPGAPANTGLPVVSGTTTEHETLSATRGEWRAWPPPAHTFQWQRCDAAGASCAAIAGATGETYRAGAADVGSTLRVVVTATNSAGTASAASNTTSAIAAGLPSLSAASVQVAEGNLGFVSASVTVSLSRASAGPVSVTYATRDATAVAPADYVAAGGTLTFAAGETAKAITVQVAGDTLDEPDEQFFVDLSSQANAVLAAAGATATIVDDDAPPAPPQQVAPRRPPPFPFPVAPSDVPTQRPLPVPRAIAAAPDAQRPWVRALATSGRRGNVIRLRYRVRDDSGRTQERGHVYSGRRLVWSRATVLRRSGSGRVYAFRWRAPRRGARALRFCVRAWDAAGNRSRLSCAAVRILRPPRRRA